MRGLMVLALGLTVAGATLAPAQPSRQRPPEPLSTNAAVKLRFAGAYDLLLVDEAGDTTVTPGLHAIMGRVWEDRGDTLVLAALSGRRPGESDFRRLPKDALARVARADVSELVVISRHPRAVHVGALAVAVGLVVLFLRAMSTMPYT